MDVRDVELHLNLDHLYLTLNQNKAASEPNTFPACDIISLLLYTRRVLVSVAVDVCPCFLSPRAAFGTTFSEDAPVKWVNEPTVAA